MLKDFLANHNIKSQAKYVEFGYGQVEPNSLSAQITGQFWAQLPAAADIDILEQGQFVKYDYAANGNGIGAVDFVGEGEWMLVYNEIKLYNEHPDGTKQWDCEFAMKKDDYQARIYSPYDWEAPEVEYQTRYLNGIDALSASSYTLSQTVSLDAGGKTVTIDGVVYAVTDSKFTYNDTEYTLNDNGEVTVPVVYSYDDVTADVKDIYEEWEWTNDPFHKLGIAHAKKMPKGTAMIPRVFKTNVGDIFTTNMINEESVTVGEKLYVGADGILCATKADVSGDMVWQVVKIYTMPDGQNGVKVMRIA